MIKRYSQNQIKQLAQILKSGGVISVPTDTVFGICAKIDSKLAYDKLIKIKNRPQNKSFPIMCANIQQIKKLAIVDEKAQKLIKEFMPGPITLVLKKNCELPQYVTNGKDTIAIRMATSKAIENLITEVGCPLFMTSANQSGKPECTSLDEIEKACPLLDGMMEGTVQYSKGSTIIDCTSEKIKILRQGPITSEQIKKRGIGQMEKRDLYDINRKPTGETIYKGEEIPSGKYIIVVLVFIQNNKGKFLIQKRSKVKNGKYATTGGHPKSGENSAQGIITEVKEEIGVELNEQDLQLYFSGRSDTEKVFWDDYYIKIDVPNIENLELQKEEVDSVCWLSIDEIKDLQKNDMFFKNHYEEFEILLQWLEGK